MPDNLARLWRRVERSFIRVDADEMTYPAHVILRFRLERALIDGALAVADLPGAWNDGFAAAAGHHAAGRRAWLSAGHPLVRRRVRLFPELHAGRDGGGAVDGGGAAGRSRRSMRRWRAAIFRRCWAGCAANVHGKGSLLDFNDLLQAATGEAARPGGFPGASDGAVSPIVALPNSAAPRMTVPCETTVRPSSRPFVPC